MSRAPNCIWQLVPSKKISTGDFIGAYLLINLKPPPVEVVIVHLCIRLFFHHTENKQQRGTQHNGWSCWGIIKG